MQLATQTVAKTATNAIETPVPCPHCGALPETTKVRGHWRSRCTSVHLRPILAASMRTKREAIRAWNDTYKEKDEVQDAPAQVDRTLADVKAPTLQDSERFVVA